MMNSAGILMDNRRPLPWVNGTLVGDHNSSGGSCYNGQQLPSLDTEGGRVVHIARTTPGNMHT